MTEEEYCAILDRFCQETVKLAKKGKLFPYPPEIAELDRQINTYWATSDLFQVICIKGFYAGQGTDWEPGQIYGTYHSRLEAEGALRALGKGWGSGCWELRVTPYAERTDSGKDKLDP